MTGTGAAAQEQLARRRALLAKLIADSDAMLCELAGVIGVSPCERLASEPQSTLDQIRAFVDKTDFAAATEDGRIWMVNRLGLYLARLLMQRHGGHLMVNEDPHSRFFMGFVVGDMTDAPAPGTTLDPFAMAYDVVNGNPKPEIARIIQDAEDQLRG